MPVPGRDDVANQVRAVHALGELAFDIVAGDGAHASEVWIDRCEYPCLDQIFLFDQLGDLRTFDDDVEDPAETAAVPSAWRCGQSDQDCLRIGVNDLSIGLRRTMMAFVDDQDVGGR